MKKREQYEQETERLLIPIIEAHQFELVDVEYVKEGSNWYACRTTADLILDEASSIRLKIKKTGEKLTVFENISLDAFPKRPNKTTRVRLILTFTSEHTAMVRVQDLGFGEFFPSSGIVVKKEIKID